MNILDDLQGIYPPLVTPFNSDESLSIEGFRAIIEHVLAGGVNGIFILGSASEGYALSRDEKIKLIELALETINRRVPLMVGTGAITTHEAVELTKIAELAGADYASILTPYFIPATQEELYQHYKAILTATRIPVLAYNNPPRTQVNLMPATAARLVREFPNFVGVKDSSGDLSLTTEYVQTCGPSFRTMTGRDTQIFAGLTNGTAGAVPAIANAVPNLVVEIYERTRRGDYAGALRVQEILAPLRRAFSLGSFPVVVKEATAMMGVPVGPCRRPIQPLAPDKKEELRRILDNILASSPA